jgi:hypothetical protein
VRGQEFLPSARSSLWTDEDEARLIEAQRKEIEIKDTFVGREMGKKKMEAAATLTRASPGTKRDLAKTWYENRSPGGRQRLAKLFSNGRDELEGVKRDREREEETSTDEDIAFVCLGFVRVSPSCLNVKPKATKRLSRLCSALINMLS